MKNLNIREFHLRPKDLKMLQLTKIVDPRSYLDKKVHHKQFKKTCKLKKIKYIFW